MLSSHGNVDSVSAAERTVGGKLCSRLRQCIIEGNELDMLERGDCLCRQSPTDWVAPRSADRCGNFGQNEVRHNNRALLLVKHLQEIATDGVKRISRVSVTSEDVCI